LGKNLKGEGKKHASENPEKEEKKEVMLARGKFGNRVDLSIQRS